MSITVPDFDGAAPPGRRPIRRLTLQFAGAAALVALADVLFYEHPIGISLAIFLVALAVACACLNVTRAGPARQGWAIALLAAGLLPIVEDVTPLSTIIALLATAFFARMLSEPVAPSWVRQVTAALRLPFAGPFRLIGDLARANRYGNRRKQKSGILSSMVGWAVPVVLCAIFASLFVSANPLLETWLARIDPFVFFEQLFSLRPLFWAVILCLVWPLVRLRTLRRKAQAAQAPVITPEARILLLDDRTITRSLILFNGLFAVQTVMDIAYLWGGVALPAGLSHAAYAHRGAYPLIVTALLAAAFVLVAMRPSGPSTRDPLVRPLVLAWVAQNVMLVASALLRLDLYVDAYSLTGLRLAAFVWMLLVAAGLVLILVQILTRRTTGWLVSANALTLALTLYAYSFVDTTVVIANYNLRHSFEMRGEGQHVDMGYLLSLGPHAIPAMDRYAPRIAAAGRSLPQPSWMLPYERIEARRNYVAGRFLDAQTDWRGWSFRDWRLAQYLARVRSAEIESTGAMNPSLSH